MRFLSAMLAICSVAFSYCATAADWHRAESDHFVVYSEDSRRETAEFAQELERLDEVLRTFTGVSKDGRPLPKSSKLTVFRFGETRHISALATGTQHSGVSGFFRGDARGPVAFVPKMRDLRRTRSADGASNTDLDDPKATLFHEYVHYFMFQHRDAPYPLWYSEGFAELFSNIEFDTEHFTIGQVPPWRSYSLATIPINLQKTFDPPATGDYETTGRIYAHGWLLASHLNLNPGRRGQMGSYIAAIGQGRAPMDAAALAFGDLEVLRAELEEFRNGRARLLKVPYAVKAASAIEVRKLSESEAARMDLMIKSKGGGGEDQVSSLTREAQELVARYPNDVAVLLAAAEAELNARDHDAAEDLARRALAREPKSVNAAIVHADAMLRRSFAEPALLGETRGRFAAANRMETDHAYPLYGFYLTHLFDKAEQVPEQAKLALETAFELAPFDWKVRRALVHLLLVENRTKEARIVGASLLTGQGGYRCMVRKQFDEFETGKRDALLETLRPDHPGEDLDKDARKVRADELEAEVKRYGCETT